MTDRGPREREVRRYAPIDFRVVVDKNADEVALPVRVELPGPCPHCGTHQVDGHLVRDEDDPNKVTIWLTWAPVDGKEDRPHRIA